MTVTLPKTSAEILRFVNDTSSEGKKNKASAVLVSRALQVAALATTFFSAAATVASTSALFGASMFFMAAYCVPICFYATATIISLDVAKTAGNAAKIFSENLPNFSNQNDLLEALSQGTICNLPIAFVHVALILNESKAFQSLIASCNDQCSAIKQRVASSLSGLKEQLKLS